MPRDVRRVVMVVDNGVRGDSRVIKSARSVQAAGYEVIVLGHGPREDVTLNGVDVRLHPVGEARRETSLPRWLLRTVAMDPGDMRAYRQRPGSAGRRGRLAARAVVGVRWRLNRHAGWGSRELEAAHTLALRYPRAAARMGMWEQLDPWLAGIWRGLVHPVVELLPDLIHAHDYRVLPAVMAAAHELRRQGRQVRIVYDAHEYVPGYVELGEKRLLAAKTIERNHIHEADAVVTVSEDLALRIQERHRLPTRPTVVCNAPEYPGGVVRGPSLRARINVSDDTPLMVYAGSVGLSRLLEQSVRTLPLLPGVHLVLVVSHPSSNVMQALAAVARGLGVTDRLHMTRYAPPDAVVDFLRDADLGLTPSKHSDNSQDSLPTKTREYLVAGVPQVGSDVRALREFITRHGIGEVFEAENLGSMVRAIQRVLADRARYARAITQELIDQNTWETQAAHLLELYEQVLAGMPAGEPRQPLEAVHPDDEEPGASRAKPEDPFAGIATRTTSHPTRLAVLPRGGEVGARCAASAKRLPGVAVTRVALGEGLVVEAPPVDWQESGALAAEEETRQGLLEALARTQTHVILEEGWGSVVGRGRHDQLAADVGMLEARGVVVGQCFGPTATKESMEIATWLGVPQFVSTPALLTALPNARWLPHLHAPGVAHDRTVLASPRPHVLHLLPAPPPEGEEEHPGALAALHEEGVIDYLALADVPDSLVPALLRRTDVLVDQRGGDRYAPSATESLAAGVLTVILAPALPPEPTPGQPEPPVVAATPDALVDLLRDVVADPASYAATALQGPAYVTRWHDGTESARVMAAFLGVDAGEANA